MTHGKHKDNRTKRRRRREHLQFEDGGRPSPVKSTQLSRGSRFEDDLLEDDDEDDGVKTAFSRDSD